MDMRKVEEILKNYKDDPTGLVSALQDIQAELRYLPREAMERTAEVLGVKKSKVYAVATFYAAFSLVPKGRTLVRICKGTACHIRGAGQLQEMVTAEIGLRPGETSGDLAYTFEAVSCLGACAMAPVVVVNDKVHGGVQPGDIKKILKG